MALTNTSGQVTDRFQYSPFGTLVYRDGETSVPFLYNGRDGVMTDNNGLYYMRARYYNPEIKRFVNQDILLGAIHNGQSLNRYAYVQGNPVSFVDPEGELGTIAVGAIAGTFIGGGLELGKQLFQGDGVDWRKVGASAVAGAATGALAGSGVGLGCIVLGNTAIAAGESIVHDLIDDNSERMVSKAIVSGAVGGLAGFVGGPGVLHGASSQGKVIVNIKFHIVEPVGGFAQKKAAEKAGKILIIKNAPFDALTNLIGDLVIDTLLKPFPVQSEVRNGK